MNVGLLSSSSPPFSEIALTCSAHIYEHTVHNPSTAICSAFKIRTREEAESFFRESQTNSCSIQGWQTHSRCDTNPPPPFSLLPQPPFRHMRSTFIKSSFFAQYRESGKCQSVVTAPKNIPLACITWYPSDEAWRKERTPLPPRFPPEYRGVFFAQPICLGQGRGRDE